jgi:hypothetical protein
VEYVSFEMGFGISQEIMSLPMNPDLGDEKEVNEL